MFFHEEIVHTNCKGGFPLAKKFARSELNLENSIYIYNFDNFPTLNIIFCYF